MTAALAVAAIIDIGLAILFTAVSGFLLQGVNNTGPMQPEATFFLSFILFCVVAPIGGFTLKRRGRAGPALALAFAPPVILAFVLMTGPGY